MKRKAQSATEFVILISFMFVVFFVFFFAIQSQIVDATQAQDMQTLEEANSLVKNYLDLARQSYPNFKHSFVLPDLGNFEYSVALEENNTIVSKIDEKEYVDFLNYDVKGFILTGSSFTNIVYHQDGYIEYPEGSGVLAYVPEASGIFVNFDAESCALFKMLNDCGSAPSSCYSVGICP